MSSADLPDSSSTQDSGSAFDEKTLCFHGAWAWSLIVAFWLAVAILAMYLLRRFVQGPFYTKRTRLDGKVVIVTGANTGIGKETAMELARRGGRVYLACRDPARCEAARLEIIQETNNQQVFNRSLDLSSLSSVRQFAERFAADEQRLDVLVNNAGIMATPHKLTADGFEQQLGVNHLGHFLLTNLLLDRLRAAAPSRIVVLTSAAHLMGRIRKQDLQREKDYTPFSAYSQSKLANILFTRKLAEMLRGTGVTVNCCHPGIVRTELSRHFDFPGWKLLQPLSRFVIKSARAGAQTSIYLALEPKLAERSGGYYMDSMPFWLPPWATNKETADWLWQESEKLVGLAPTAVSGGQNGQNGAQNGQSGAQNGQNGTHNGQNGAQNGANGQNHANGIGSNGETIIDNVR